MNPLLKNLLNERKLKVWVLAPGQSHGDENLDYYYDFTQSISEYNNVFNTLGIPWIWKQVTLENFRTTIDEIRLENEGFVPLILNLCDGDEVNGAPGISVIRYLDEKELVYTGSDEQFFDITTSKIPMKEAFDKEGVSNANWYAIRDNTFDAEEIIEKVGTPLILKPAVSGGSMGVGIKNVVDNADDLKNLILETQKGYRGWDLLTDGLVAEKFIVGREFTVFITGSWNKPDEARLYPPVERLFHESLPEKQRFLSFDRLWEIYENESPMPLEGDFYQYGIPEAELHEPILQLSWKAYASLKGKGYTRIDVRMDGITGNLYVLEANAQCGLSEDENYTSIGAILRLSDNSFSDAILEIMNDGFERHLGNNQAFTI
jgi:D-alanine-D-alanine ligase